MKFALKSSVGEDLAALAERCRGLKYEGVELDAPSGAAAETRKIFDDAGLQIACLGISARFTQDKEMDARAGDAVRAGLETAQHLGCHMLKIPDAQPVKRQSVMTTISAMATWLTPLANAAADRGIAIVIENGECFSTARPLWMLMERLEHSAVGIYWNVQRTIAAGEAVAVTVPTLNSRIRYVQMGQENTEIMSRLKGIGYQGWVGRK